MTGFINSFQSLGTVDGPGIRFVVFMQGCNLRCGCCHNPDTWELNAGNGFTPDEVFEKLVRFKSYFSREGGITVSGGEPLIQSEFVYELFTLCKNNGINTVLDTSGSIINDKVLKLLTVTDRILLDIKYKTDAEYKKYVGCGIDKVLEFLRLADEKNIPITLRQVTIPTLNDTEDDMMFLKSLADKYKVIDKIELLPFRKLCESKYDNLGIDFRFKDIPTPTREKMDHLNAILNNK